VLPRSHRIWLAASSSRRSQSIRRYPPTQRTDRPAHPQGKSLYRCRTVQRHPPDIRPPALIGATAMHNAGQVILPVPRVGVAAASRSQLRGRRQLRPLANSYATSTAPTHHRTPPVPPDLHRGQCQLTIRPARCAACSAATRRNARLAARRTERRLRHHLDPITTHQPTNKPPAHSRTAPRRLDALLRNLKLGRFPPC